MFEIFATTAPIIEQNVIETHGNNIAAIKSYLSGVSGTIKQEYIPAELTRASNATFGAYLHGNKFYTMKGRVAKVRTVSASGIGSSSDLVFDGPDFELYYNHTRFQHGDVAFAFGSRNQTYLMHIDFVNNLITKLPDTGLSNAGGGVVDGYLYVLGGLYPNNRFNTNKIYRRPVDDLTSPWEEFNITGNYTSNLNPRLYKFNGQAFIIGGGVISSIANSNIPDATKVSYHHSIDLNSFVANKINNAALSTNQPMSSGIYQDGILINDILINPFTGDKIGQFYGNSAGNHSIGFIVGGELSIRSALEPSPGSAIGLITRVI